MCRKSKYVWALFVGIFVLTFSPLRVDADTGVSVNPGKLDLRLLGGVRVFEAFSVTNNTGRSVTIKVPSSGTVGSSVSFVLLSGEPSQFTLSAGATEVVNYSITAGPSAPQVINNKGNIEFILTGIGEGVLSAIKIPVEVKVVNRNADINVSDITAYPKPIEGQAVTLTGILKNENATGGSVATDNCQDAGPFNVKWYINGTQVQYKGVGGIKAGGQVSVILERPTGVELQGGKCIVQLKADVDSDVDEFSESNNEKTKDITGSEPETVFKSGILTRDETWVGVINVTGDVTVSPGVTLTISPDTKVYFAARSDDTHSGLASGLSELIVKGNLNAVGNSAKQITFSSDASNKTKGDWQGIIVDKAEGLNIQYCLIEYAKTAINLTLPNSASFNIEETTISNNSDYGIYCKAADVNGVGSLTIFKGNIYNNGADGVYLETAALKARCDVSFSNVNIYNNNNGISCDAKYAGTVNVSVTNSNIHDNNLDGIGLKRRGALSKITLTANHNSICNNKDMGIRCSVSQPAEIHYNNIYGNSEYDIQNYSFASINAQNNWWGRDTTNQMNAGAKNITKIFDHKDSLIRGTVNYSPWLASEISTGEKDSSSKSKEKSGVPVSVIPKVEAKTTPFKK